VIRSFIRVSSALVFCVLQALTAFGQATVTNPKVVEFDPSADHAAVSADGQPLVARYDLQIYLQGATQPVTTASLGKPALDVDGKIRVDFSTIMVGWPLANGTYEARVSAVGAAGSGLSDASNVFDFQSVVVPPPCTYALSATAGTVGASGGPSSVTVTASATTCGWTAASDAAWATVAPASGTGTAAVVVTVAANPGTARTATVTAGGQTYTVSQAAAPPPCTFTLSASTASASGAGGGASVTLTASASSCAWTSSTATDWVTGVTGGGTGSAVVSYSLTRNTTGHARTGTLTAGGQLLTVTQASLAAPLQPRNLKIWRK
jgi:hypothetical protein